MKSTFDKAFQAVLHWEGGYVDDPGDPGGETKYGISKQAYPDLDIAGLTKKRAKQIYRSDYWEPSGCDELPSGLDLFAFDTAVNCGVRFAIRALQQAVGTNCDGIFGPQTKAAAEAADPREALREYVARRGVRYGKLDTFSRFGLGWMRRLSHIHQLALSLTKE
mgnify:FL=1